MEKDSYEWDIKVVLDDYDVIFVGYFEYEWNFRYFVFDIYRWINGGNLDRSLNCKDCVIVILFVNCYWYDLIGGFKEKN